MKKGEFIQAINDEMVSAAAAYNPDPKNPKYRIDKKLCQMFLNSFEKVVTINVFEAEDEMRFSFGTLSGFTKVTPARTCRNPRTGGTIDAPEKVVHGFPRFKSSRNMRKTDAEKAQDRLAEQAKQAAQAAAEESPLDGIFDTVE